MVAAAQQVNGLEAKTATLYELASFARSCAYSVFAYVNSIVRRLRLKLCNPIYTVKICDIQL